MNESRSIRFPPSERRNRRSAHRNFAFGREAADRAGGGGGVRRLPGCARRSRAAGRTPTRRSAWTRSDARDPDGIGPVEVAKPKSRDRGAATADERIRYASSILPKWGRGARGSTVLLPALRLRRGVSTGDFQEVLTALLGKDAPNLSPAVIARLKSEWEDEYRRWQGRDLSARRYVYVWATASICRRAWSRRPNVCWCSSARRPRARKSRLSDRHAGKRAEWKELLSI